MAYTTDITGDITGDTDLTKGWDVVFAVRYSVLNTAIRNTYKTKPDSMPGKFSGNTHGKLGSNEVVGSWGVWQITTGGSGIYIQMNCPIAAGWYNGDKLDLTGYTVVIRVQLDFFEHKTEGDTSLKQELKLRLDKSDPNNPPVVIVTILDPQGIALEAGDAGMLEGPFKAWFTDNLVLFDHVFCTADTTETESTADGLYWLKPSFTACAAAEPTATTGLTQEQIMDQSVFAVLHTIEGRKPEGLAAEIDLNAIPMGKNTALSFSNACFLRHFIEPALPFLFQIDTSQCTDKAAVERLLKEFGENFEVVNDGKEISNKRNLSLPPMRLPEDVGGKIAHLLKEYGEYFVKGFANELNPPPPPPSLPEDVGGKIVHPDIEAGDFSIEVDGQVLRVTFTNMHYEYSPGIDVYLTYQSELMLSMKDKRLQLTETKRSIKGQVTKSSLASWFQIAGGIALGIILIPIGGALGKVIGGEISVAISGAAEGLGDEAGQLLIPATEAGIGDLAGTAARDAELAEQEAAQAAAEETNAIVAGALRVTRSVTGYLKSNVAKILGSMAAAGVGGTIAATPDIMRAIANGDLSNIPDLTKFSKEILFNISWADASNFEPDCAELHDALQISGNVTVDVKK